MKKIKIKKKNFITKFLIKLLRRLGYEIIDQSSLKIPFNNNINSTEDLKKNGITLPLGKVDLKKRINEILIIQRIFTNETSLLSQNKQRIFENEKFEYSLRSINSILVSCKYAYEKNNHLKFNFKIIDDNSSQEILKKIKKIISNFDFIKFEVLNLEIDKYKNKMKFKNNDRFLSHNAHIYLSKEIALKENSDLVYFVEDDYLHLKNSIWEAINSYEKFFSIIKDDLILLPTDYPYLYFSPNQSCVTIGHEHHWRVIDQSLCTYFTTKDLIKNNWSYYEDMMTNCHDPYEKPLHEIYKKNICLSPIPSLAVHLTNINSIYGISPLIDIEKLWNDSAYE